MGDLESDIHIEEFTEISSAVIQAAEENLKKDNDDLKSMFYLGTVTGYLSVAEMKKGNVWSAYRKAVKSKDIMEKCLKIDPAFREPLLLIGACNYWLSAKNIFRKITFLFDNRDKGIRQITESLEKDSMNYAFGLNQLIWILLHYKKFDRAESLVKEGLENFPNSRFFLYPAAETYKRSGRPELAIGYYKKVIQSLETDKLTDRYFYLKNKVKLAETSYGLGDIKTALELCDEIMKNGVIEQEKEVTGDIYKRIEDLRKSSLKKQKN
jgi:tetratricopeptide (TPR) repeat protein